MPESSKFNLPANIKPLMIWIIGCSFIVCRLFADTPVFMHDLEPKSGIGYEIMGSDPYFVYSLPSRSFPSKTVVLEIKTKSEAGLPSTFTLDLFWTTADYDFGEEHKISFRIPRGSGTTKWRLDIQDIAFRKKLDSSAITRIRFDPNLEAGNILDFAISLAEGSAIDIGHLSLLPYDFTDDPLLINPGIPIRAINNIGALDGQFKVTEGDPYFVFDLGQDGLDLEQTDALLINFQPDFSQQRFSYFEIFWAGQNHGFSEAYKAFFLYPIRNTPILVNLEELLRVVEPSVDRLTGLRVDIQYPFPSPFYLEVTSVNSRSLKDSDASYKEISLRYSILPEYLNKPDLTGFSLQESVKEFLNRVIDEWFFFLFYGLIQLGLIVLILNIFTGSSRFRR